MFRETSFSNYFEQNNYSTVQLLLHEARFISYQKRNALICIKILQGNQVFTSETKSNENLNPKWNQSFQLNMSGIEIIVNDQNMAIGSLSLDLRELQSNNLNEWYSFSDKKQITGTLRLTFQFNQNNKIQKCQEQLQCLFSQLEVKLKQQRIASPTVGSVQLMQQFLTKQKHNNSNIINSEYQIGNEFDVHNIKQQMNEIKQLINKFQQLQAQKSRVYQQQKIISKQKEINDLQQQIAQSKESVQSQIALLKIINEEGNYGITKKQLILQKYKKKQQVLISLKQKLNEHKFDKRQYSLVVQAYKYEGRPRQNNSEFQVK
ncbi:unnamed protein product [Paramecium sonneborni]|uniref:C2 domain-containing protein n=1 Tax=Paramecium sonneborni TaxID=65129 RepID=A0A8S1KUM7_9CILI|nr:unnamed protein product [Paramecium sonneborni]